MFLFFILSSARWPHLYSISQGTSGFGCFMTQCCSLERQCSDLKHGVRMVIYSCLWPKCCCCCSRWALVLPWLVLRALWQSLAEGRAVPAFFILLVLEHTCPQCQIFLPGCGVCFPLEFPELCVLFYPLILFFHSSPLYEFGLLGVDALFYVLLRKFLWVTGRILCRMSCSQNCFLWCLLSFYTFLLCELTCTAQKPFLRQMHSGVCPGCNNCLGGAKNIQVTLSQVFWQKS